MYRARLRSGVRRSQDFPFLPSHQLMSLWALNVFLSPPTTSPVWLPAPSSRLHLRRTRILEACRKSQAVAVEVEGGEEIFCIPSEFLHPESLASWWKRGGEGSGRVDLTAATGWHPVGESEEGSSSWGPEPCFRDVAKFRSCSQ